MVDAWFFNSSLLFWLMDCKFGFKAICLFFVNLLAYVFFVKRSVKVSWILFAFLLLIALSGIISGSIIGFRSIWVSFENYFWFLVFKNKLQTLEIHDPHQRWVKINVGTGKNTSLWSERRIKPSTLKVFYSRLYNLSTQKGASMAFETVDMGGLSNLEEIWRMKRLTSGLTSWTSFIAYTSWHWKINEFGKLDNKGYIITKSLAYDLGSDVNSPEHPFHAAIWNDFYPRKIKFFLWKISHSHAAINTSDKLQAWLPYKATSPIVVSSAKLADSSKIFFYTVTLPWGFGRKSFFPLDGPQPSRMTQLLGWI